MFSCKVTLRISIEEKKKTFFKTILFVCFEISRYKVPLWQYSNAYLKVSVKLQGKLV